jgi:hypothetical protein
MKAGAVRISGLGAARTATLVNNGRSSSWRANSARRRSIVLAALFLASTATAAVSLSPAETRRIGKKIWQNECNGTLAGLTSWNEGENFASLGIGHFIWYPEGARGPFEESFPQFVRFVADTRAREGSLSFPRILDPKGRNACPWNSRTAFLSARNSPEMNELRNFLANSIDLQAEFLVQRLQQALPKMLAETAASKRAQVRQQFDRVVNSAAGCYALVDYVNFKGEGVLATERYAGQGWGLLQVLEGMSQESSGRETVTNFAQSAKTVLTRRVRNSPPERKESRWLPGWLHRIDTYVQN